uniref:Post-GPI attachment to proteins factor 3 n=1 Tax=Romanomermis culicivorax TaxID=13658 RepID=A0A915KXA9_ROMCU
MKFRMRQNYVWKCAFPILAACILISLEAFDFPPFFWIFDAHSLWHLGTTPLPIFWAHFVVDDCKYYQELKMKFA